MCSSCTGLEVPAQVVVIRTCAATLSEPWIPEPVSFLRCPSVSCLPPSLHRVSSARPVRFETCPDVPRKYERCRKQPFRSVPHVEQLRSRLRHVLHLPRFHAASG